MSKYTLAIGTTNSNSRPEQIIPRRGESTRPIHNWCGWRKTFHHSEF